MKRIDENGVKELTEALINWCDNDVDYDTLENIATGGASPPMARTGTRSAGTRAATLEPAGGYSKKSFLWIAPAVVLIGVVGAWFLFFRTPPIAEVDLPAEADAETSATVESPLPQTVEPVYNRVTFSLDNSGETPQAAASSSSPPSQNDSSMEDEPEVNITRLPAPETKTTNIAASDPANTDSRTSPAAETFEFETASEFYARGQQRVKSRDWVGAESDFSKAITLSSNEPTYFRVRGNVRLRQSDLLGAKLDYNKAIALAPRYSAVYNSRGVLRKREGDLTGARNDYDEAIALNPIKSSYFRNRANLRRPLGDLEGSMEDYNQALSVNQNEQHRL